MTIKKYLRNRAKSEKNTLQIPTTRFAMPFSLLCIVGLIITIGLMGCTPLLADRAEKQIVVLWHNFTGVEAEALQSIADTFNAENSWDLVLITEYQHDLIDKVQVPPDSRPDIITIRSEDLPSYIGLGLIGAGP